MGELLSIGDLGKEMGISKKGVYQRIHKGQLPTPLRIGDTPFWQRVDWVNWLAQLARDQGAMIGPEGTQGAGPADPTLSPVPSIRRRGRPRKEANNEN